MNVLGTNVYRTRTRNREYESLLASCEPAGNACSMKAASMNAGQQEIHQQRGGGSDGDRLREIDVVSLPLIPFLYPGRLLRVRRRSGIGRYAIATKGPRIPRERWPEVA